MSLSEFGWERKYWEISSNTYFTSLDNTNILKYFSLPLVIKLHFKW